LLFLPKEHPQRRRRLDAELDDLLLAPATSSGERPCKYRSLLGGVAAGGHAHYVPAPMLDPRRCGTGLYRRLVETDASDPPCSSSPTPPSKLGLVPLLPSFADCYRVFLFETNRIGFR